VATPSILIVSTTGLRKNPLAQIAVMCHHQPPCLQNQEAWGSWRT